MRLQDVIAIYKDVGKERCESLFAAPQKRKTKRHLSDKAVKHVLGMIKKHKKITRKILIRDSGLSRTTVESAIRELSMKFLIKKNRDSKIVGHPITYLAVEKEA